MSLFDQLVRRYLQRRKDIGRREFLRTAVIGSIAGPRIFNGWTRPVATDNLFWLDPILQLAMDAPTLDHLFSLEPYNALPMPVIHWVLVDEPPAQYHRS